MLTRFTHALAAASVTAALFVAATPIAAQDSDVVVRGLPEGAKVEHVSHRDLNLRLIAHLNILNERVGRAVREVCDFEPREGMRESYRNCADAAWAGARPQVHRAYLQANRLAMQ